MMPCAPVDYDLAAGTKNSPPLREDRVDVHDVLQHRQAKHDIDAVTGNRNRRLRTEKELYRRAMGVALSGALEGFGIEIDSIDLRGPSFFEETREITAAAAEVENRLAVQLNGRKAAQRFLEGLIPPRVELLLNARRFATNPGIGPGDRE